MLDQEHLRQTEARCTQEAAPRCQDSCPLRMDVRGFMTHMKDGKLSQARGLLERHLPLPGILARICDHPCENVCLRRDLGGSLAVHALEHFCINASDRPRPLPRRQKEGSVAVLGNGLAGLTAAFDLHRKGFSVTVFHEEQPWSTLVRRFSALDAATAQDELDVLAGEGLRFVCATLDSALHEKAVKEFTVVCVDADAAPGIAVRAAGVDPVTLCAADAVCHCGWLSVTPTGHSYASASAQAGEGRRAAVTLERMLTGVSLTAARPDAADGRQLHTPLDGITPVPRMVPAAASPGASAATGWTQQECTDEAARCLLCQCMACVRECVYLQKYRGYPRTYTRQIHNNAAIVKGQHMANPLINGCALCGQCTEICPERFSMADLCLTARRDMVERGTMPPSAHEFALEDMESATGGNALFLPDPQKSDAQHGQSGAASRSGHALMPGCQLWAARGEQVLALHSHVRAVLTAQGGQEAGGNAGGGESGGLGLILSCCGIPARWAGREEMFQGVMADFRTRWEGLGRPQLLCACSSCLTVLRAELPESNPVSVWEVLAAASVSVPETTPGTASAMTSAVAAPQVLSMHDPCTARHDTAWQQAVRALARRQNITVHEPRRSGVETPCCGYGGLVWNAQPELADAMTAHRAAELPHTGLASCIMCRDRLAAQGKPCLHVLDIMPATAGFAPPADHKGPGLSARRAGRDALRRRLRKEWLGQNASASRAQNASASPVPNAPETPDAQGMAVLLAPGLLERLEARHILLQDVEEAVRGVESTGNCFEDAESGHSLGSWTPRHVTFWVEYSVTGEGCVVHDAWCHRMRVPGAGSLGAGETAASAASPPKTLPGSVPGFMPRSVTAPDKGNNEGNNA